MTNIFENSSNLIGCNKILETCFQQRSNFLTVFVVIEQFYFVSVERLIEEEDYCTQCRVNVKMKFPK